MASLAARDAARGAIVGACCFVPLVLFVTLGWQPTMQRETPLPASWLGLMVAFAVGTGAVAGVGAGRMTTRRGPKTMALAATAYCTALVVTTLALAARNAAAGSAPLAAAQVVVLGVALLAVTAPVVLVPALVGAWLLARWTERSPSRR